MIAYASDRGGSGNQDIWIQQIAGGPPLRRTTHPAQEGSPSFSPDGSKIVFRSTRDGGGIYEIPTLGGTERRIADFGTDTALLPRRLQDRRHQHPGVARYAADENLPSSLPGGSADSVSPGLLRQRRVRQPGSGLVPRRKASPFQRPADRRSGHPRLVGRAGRRRGPGPDGRARRPGPVRRPGRSRTPGTAIGSIYSTGTTVDGVNIYRARIDPKTFKVAGSAERITSGPGMQYQTAALKDGRLVYANITWIANIWLSDADPEPAGSAGRSSPPPRTPWPSSASSLSRDGAKLVFTAFGGVRGRRFEVRWKNLVSGEERSYDIRSIGFGQNPRLSPDGKVFSYRDGPGEQAPDVLRQRPRRKPPEKGAADASSWHFTTTRISPSFWKGSGAWPG